MGKILEKYAINVNKLTKKRYKNYKELCNELDIKIGTGLTKKSQLEVMKSYFDYEKEGNAFIIKKIYDKQRYVEDVLRKDKKHIEQIERLIVDLLLRNSEKDIFTLMIGRYELLKEIAVINQNYSKCKFRTSKLSKYLDININTINDWYNTTDYVLLSDVTHALNRLEDKAIIMWHHDIMVSNIDYGEGERKRSVNIVNDEITEYHSLTNDDPSYSVDVATKSQKNIILNAEKIALNTLGYENKSKVIISGNWDSFQEIVKNILVEYDIANYYKCFNIVYSIDNVKDLHKKWTSLLSIENRIKKINSANNNIRKNISNNIDSKIEKSKNKSNFEKSDRDINRDNTKYKKDTKELTNKLLDNKSKLLWKEVKDIKIE